RLNPIAVANLGEFVSNSAPTKMVVVRLPEVEAGLLPQLQRDFVGELLIFSSVPQYCEMVNPNVDKGRALANLIGRLGIPREAVADRGVGFPRAFQSADQLCRRSALVDVWSDHFAVRGYRG